MADLEDRIEQRVRTVMALFHEGLYRQILILVPNMAVQEIVFDAFAWAVKHTKVVTYRRDMRFTVPSLVGTKRDGEMCIAMPKFERLRGHEWDLLVEFGEITSGSAESIQALYYSVRVGNDPLVIRWDV